MELNAADLARMTGLLRARDINARARALEEMAAIGPRARPLLPSALVCADDSSSVVRERAVEAIAAMACGSVGAVWVLARRLSDESVRVRHKAARALQDLAGDAMGIAPQLLAALRDESALVRASVLDVLGRTPGLDPALVPALVAGVSNCLGDPAPQVRQGAASCLARVWERMPPSMRASLFEEIVLPESLQARVGPRAAVRQILRGALDDASPQVRVAAADALLTMGEHAEGLKDMLTAHLLHGDPAVQRQAARAVARHGV